MISHFKALELFSMGAVAQKKMCWNCEGNVARTIDNCPYCGVYLHVADESYLNANGGPFYRPVPQEEEEQPSSTPRVTPIQEESQKDENLLHQGFYEGSHRSILEQCKRDIFPLLFLMMGSVFFLFGVVVFLFSQNGTFTLQWQEQDGWVFLGVALPFIILGWRFLQQLDDDTRD